VNLVSRLTYVRYVVASAGALGLDSATFLGLLSLGFASLYAAATGYMLGMVFHWLMSSRAVFVGRLAEEGAARRQQQGMFVASALAGLTITLGIIGFADLVSTDPRPAQLVAIAISFQVTYVLRKKLVFA